MTHRRTNLGVLILFVTVALFSEICTVGAHIKQHRVLRTNANNCSMPDHDESDFPADIFTTEQRRSGALLLHIICGLYCFVIIAFVCNDYFLPAVDCICQDLNLSKDIAGATFMAFATSAPELFVNVIGTFLTESDLGVGTVVGSAVFNTLGVAACAGLAATSVIPLELWPLARDCSIYAFVVAVLTVILWDSRVQWYEALVLLFLYVLYCIVLLCQQRLHKAAKSVLGSNNSFHSQNSTVALHMDTQMSNGTYRPLHHHGEVIGWEKRPSTIKPDEVKSVELAKKRAKKEAEVSAAAAKQKELESAEEEQTSMCQPPDGIMKKLWWFYSWPVAFLLYITVPDCRTRRALYPATFLMCVIWIGATSYIVSWMMTVIGDTLGISDSVMGLTLVAMGGSMPEASTSVINARKGIASMTISNALGGNTLDILLSLGLPWFIKTLLPSTASTGGAVVIQSKNLVYNNVAQLACVAFLFVAASLNRLRMNRRLGFVCLVLYLAFIAFIVCLEAGVFSAVEPISVC